MAPSTLADDGYGVPAAVVAAGFVGALTLLAVGLYTAHAQDPSETDRLLALRIVGIIGVEREWIESDLSAARRRMETDCVRGVARRRGPADWQVVDGTVLSVTLTSPDAAGAGETVFFSPAAPPRIASASPGIPPAAGREHPIAAPPIDHAGFRTYAASAINPEAISTVGRFPDFAAAAAALPSAGSGFIVAGAPPADPAFYAVTVTSGTRPVVPAPVGPGAPTTVYERQTVSDTSAAAALSRD